MARLPPPPLHPGVWRQQRRHDRELNTPRETLRGAPRPLVCCYYVCFLHYFALFGGLGLNRQAYRVTFGTFYIFLTQNIRNSNTPPCTCTPSSETRSSPACPPLECCYYVCFLHYFALFGGLGLNRQAYRVTFGTFYIFLTQNIRNSNTPCRSGRETVVSPLP